MSRKHERYETPVGIRYNADRSQGSLSETGHVYERANFPETEIQALMEADAFEEPRVSLETLQHRTTQLFEVVADLLDEDESIVFDCLFFADMSLSEAGEMLAVAKGRPKNVPYSKSWVAKVRDRALGKLRNSPELRELVDFDMMETMGVEDDTCVSDVG